MSATQSFPNPLQNETGTFDLLGLSDIPACKQVAQASCGADHAQSLADEKQRCNPQNNQQAQEEQERLTKTCTKCGQEKDGSLFNKRSRGSKVGLQSYCIECQKVAQKQHPQGPKNAKKQKESGYRLSGAEGTMTREDYERMYQEQGGRCLICGRHSERLHIDHDHKTGYVRGLLCRNCNIGIGNLQDDPEILRRAAAYILDATIRNETLEILGRCNQRL